MRSAHCTTQAENVNDIKYLEDFIVIHSLQLFMTKSHPRPLPQDIGSAMEKFARYHPVSSIRARVILEMIGFCV